VILSGWAWVLAGERTQPHTRPATPTPVAKAGDVIRLTWPTWIAVAIYLALRAQTTAMTPTTAPASYQFVLAPGALFGNALEYLDRACTFSLIVLLVAHLLAWRRPALTQAVRRMMILGVIWFVGTFSLTIFVPNRSSLYALLPSAAPTLIAGFLLQQLWDESTAVRRRRLVAAALVLPVLLLPVYWTRNVRWIEIAQLSADTFEVVRRVARERPDVDLLLFRDDRNTRRSFVGAYDQLLPDAVRLAAGRDIRAQLENGGGPDGPPLRDAVGGGAVLIVLEDGQVRVE
jgi:hypothetical protein